MIPMMFISSQRLNCLQLSHLIARIPSSLSNIFEFSSSYVSYRMHTSTNNSFSLIRKAKRLPNATLNSYKRNAHIITFVTALSLPSLLSSFSSFSLSSSKTILRLPPTRFTQTLNPFFNRITHQLLPCPNTVLIRR